MTEVVLYHHVQGLTEGVRSFADELRQAGHTVHTPDLFDGRTFDTIEEGMAFAREAGFGALAERGVAAAEGIGPDVVYAGFSFGVMVAQQLAQTRPGARGALLMSCVPPSLGVRGRVARGRPSAGARQGRRPVLRRRPRGRAGARRVDRPRRAVPLPGGGTPLRRLLAPGVRRRRCGIAHRARAGVPRHGPGRHATNWKASSDRVIVTAEPSSGASRAAIFSSKASTRPQPLFRQDHR